jgi:hypothetical protein
MDETDPSENSNVDYSRRSRTSDIVGDEASRVPFVGHKYRTAI